MWGNYQPARPADSYVEQEQGCSSKRCTMHVSCTDYRLHLTGPAFEYYWPHFRGMSRSFRCSMMRVVDANLSLAVIPFQIDSQLSAAIAQNSPVNPPQFPVPFLLLFLPCPFLFFYHFVSDHRNSKLEPLARKGMVKVNGTFLLESYGLGRTGLLLGKLLRG
ncbi:hypothetical protein VTN00DRAFT_2203 [Thermoascus crustaceus]|uniref:uncharacterized protein n=1 Tax=Thermoascus crustaceus TaxID=5088 RepID=UPI0037428B7C